MYNRHKVVLDDMRRLEEDRRFRTPCGFASEELCGLATKALVDVELESLTLFRLLQAFTRVMHRYEEGQKKQAVHQVVRWPYTIRDKQSYIRSLLQPGLRVSFEDLFRPCENRVHAIVTFLALLELLNKHNLDIVQGEGYGDYFGAY